jgi:hypothetical protein
MTLAICVVTSDGVAMAADSGCHLGWAFLLGRNITGHMADFIRTLEGSGPVDDHQTR